MSLLIVLAVVLTLALAGAGVGYCVYNNIKSKLTPKTITYQ